MNYIKKLEIENRILKQGNNELRRYLNSEKFWEDNRVNVNDIFLRMDETSQLIDETINCYS
jgi:hypothetical protein|tara:strand:- start:233 stop:415 length:183 start_codon:yes stop_codon:yes gene_type:complete